MNEVLFYGTIAVLVAIAAYIFPHTKYAMWFGFGVAAFSAIANDSIQTLGTFLSSNRKLPWWVLWLFVGGILVTVHVYGWYNDGGDIAFGRLLKIPQPTSYTFLSLAGPIALLLLTRWRMPVSTTFLILSAFSAPDLIQSMLTKTFMGYIVAFLCAIAVWSLTSYLYHWHEFPSKNYNVNRWRLFQACSTAFLWMTWLMQDTANVAVFLPRSMTFNEMAIAVGYMFFMIGGLMYVRGGRIQVVVTEKTDITDLRAATIIDITYALILLVFKQWNHIPMSTTWVFLGLLAGREIALTLFTQNPKPYKKTMFLVFKDIMRASFGLLISLLIVVFMR